MILCYFSDKNAWACFFSSPFEFSSLVHKDKFAWIDLPIVFPATATRSYSKLTQWPRESSVHNWNKAHGMRRRRANYLWLTSTSITRAARSSKNSLSPLSFRSLTILPSGFGSSEPVDHSSVMLASWRVKRNWFWHRECCSVIPCAEKRIRRNNSISLRKFFYFRHTFTPHKMMKMSVSNKMDSFMKEWNNFST